MSTADHPETDGLTERVNRVVKDIIRIIAVDHRHDWSRWLLFAEFVINNNAHSLMTVTAFSLNTSPPTSFNHSA